MLTPVRGRLTGSVSCQITSKAGAFDKKAGYESLEKLNPDPTKETNSLTLETLGYIALHSQRLTERANSKMDHSRA